MIKTSSLTSLASSNNACTSASPGVFACSMEMETGSNIASILTEVDCGLGSLVEYNLSEFRDDVFKMLSRLRAHRNLTDVQLVVDIQAVHAHKVVLAAASPYFNAMFTSGLKESDTSRVRLQGVSPDIVISLVHFMYSGELSINEHIVCPLLSAASMYQMKHVVNACCRFLEDQIEANNVIGICNFALQQGCTELHTKATTFIEQNFSEVSTTDEFLELTGSNLAALIQKDELNVPDEEAVYNAVMRWVAHRPRDRRAKMPSILKFIRCHYLPPRFLSDQMSNCNIVKSIPACKEYLAKIFTELSLHKPQVGGVRCPPKTMCLFHLVGGYSDRKSQSALYCYDVDKNTWAELGPMEVARSGLGAAFLRGALYAVAGRSNSSGEVVDTDVLTKYNHCDGAWTVCSRLQERRNRLGVCVLDSLIYAVAGVDGVEVLDSVEKYDPLADSWKYVSPLHTARTAHCCAVLHRLLYAVGGCDGTKRIASVECYDPDKDEWTDVAPLNVARSGAGAAVVDNKIYVVGGHDGEQQLNSVEMFDPVCNTWTTVAPMKVCRSALAIACSFTKIYAMGGFDGSNLLSSVEVYNVEGDSWSDGPAMPWGRSGHAIAVPNCLLGSPKDGTEPS